MPSFRRSSTEFCVANGPKSLFFKLLSWPVRVTFESSQECLGPMVIKQGMALLAFLQAFGCFQRISEQQVLHGNREVKSRLLRSRHGKLFESLAWNSLVMPYVLDQFTLPCGQLTTFGNGLIAFRSSQSVIELGEQEELRRKPLRQFRSLGGDRINRNPPPRPVRPAAKCGRKSSSAQRFGAKSPALRRLEPW
jgi:hypothetical protein